MKKKATVSPRMPPRYALVVSENNRHDSTHTDGQALTKYLPGPVYPQEAVHLRLRRHFEAVDQSLRRETGFSGAPKSRGRPPFSEGDPLYCVHSLVP